jgi:two-component system sensor histidine kinase KdpD
VVVYVETPHARLSEQARARVAATMQLAEGLGAETATLRGSSVSAEILAYARSRNVSQIVIGKPARPVWRRILIGSDVDALVRGSGDIDISVISGERERDEIGLPRRLGSHRAAPAAYAWAVVAVLLATGAGYVMFPRFELANIVMIYLLGVVAVARLGRWPTVLAALLSVTAFDVFFVGPYYSFAVANLQYLVTLAVMLTVALLMSGLTVRVIEQAETARTRERRTAALSTLTRELADAREVVQQLEVGIRHLVDVFGGQIALLLPDAGGHLQTRASLMSPSQLDAADVAVAQWAYDHVRPAGAGTANLPRPGMLFVPLRALRGTVGVLGIRPTETEVLGDREWRLGLETFGTQIALAIERNALAEEAQRAQVRIDVEELRNALLTSVSQDLRAPLAAITSAADTLVTAGDTLPAPAQKDLAEAIRENAARLHRFASIFLDTTHLELHREQQPLADVVAAVLKPMRGRLERHPVGVSIPSTLPLVPIDGPLIEQVFFNLLDNAVKYTPEGCPIEITAEASASEVTVGVADRGPGLAPEVLDRVFEEFYRVKSTVGQAGAGLGLAICRAIVRAHGGRVWAENRAGGGLVVRFTLPRADGSPSPSTAV